MSSEEFKKMLGYKKSLRNENEVKNIQLLNTDSLPTSVDWFKAGKV